MLADIIVGVLEGIARVVGMSREAFGRTVEEVGKSIRAGDLIPNEAFGRAKEDAEILSELNQKFGG